MTTDKLSISVPKAMDVSGLGRNTIYDAISAGKLRSLKVGRRRLIMVDDLKAWLETLVAPPAPMQPAGEAPPCPRGTRSRRRLPAQKTGGRAG